MLHEESHRKKLDRLNTFVDAVLAIVITLLVLELRLPELEDVNSSGEMMEKLHKLIPHFLAFLLCFLAVAQIWLANNAFFTLLNRYTNTMAVLVMLMLLPFCLLPFAASIIGEYPMNPGSYVVFGGLYLYSTIITSIQMQYYWKNRILSPLVNLKLFEERVMKFWWVSPIIVLLIIGSAFIHPTLSLLLFASMLSLWVYMTKQIQLLAQEEQERP